MAARRTLDRQPGPPPEIRTDGDSVTFSFDLPDVPEALLEVRCDATGEVWASIAYAPPPRPPYPFICEE